jgi:tetratricopeptide (TPR) repeat protein
MVLRVTDMRYIYVILAVLIISSACKSQSSPNMPSEPAAVTLPASPNTPAVVEPTPPPTTIQPTLSHSDETIRIARTELERDTYNQAWKECQKSFDNIKWVIQIALTAIGLILALFGLVIFKNSREFREAVSDARKACEKAEEWEEKARNTCNKIDDLVKTKLAEIEKKNEEQVKNATEKIDTLVKAKLEESTKKIDDKSENEKRISELWYSALKLDMKGKYEEAQDKYAELANLRPDDYWNYKNWGISLFYLAKIRNDRLLFEQACRKYEQAVKVKPDMHEAYYNWGIALGNLAMLKGNEELFKEACGKYAKAIEIKPDEHEAYNGWAGCLIEFAKIKIGTPEYEGLLKEAEEKALKAESLKKSSAIFNLACIYALRGNKKECRKWLLAGQEAGTLPTKDEAIKARDFDSVKDEAWFKEIKWEGEK